MRISSFLSWAEFWWAEWVISSLLKSLSNIFAQSHSLATGNAATQIIFSHFQWTYSSMIALQRDWFEYCLIEACIYVFNLPDALLLRFEVVFAFCRKSTLIIPKLRIVVPYKVTIYSVKDISSSFENRGWPRINALFWNLLLPCNTPSLDGKCRSPSTSVSRISISRNNVLVEPQFYQSHRYHKAAMGTFLDIWPSLFWKTGPPLSPNVTKHIALYFAFKWCFKQVYWKYDVWTIKVRTIRKNVVPFQITFKTRRSIK